MSLMKLILLTVILLLPLNLAVLQIHNTKTEKSTLPSLKSLTFKP